MAAFEKPSVTRLDAVVKTSPERLQHAAGWSRPHRRTSAAGNKHRRAYRHNPEKAHAQLRIADKPRPALARAARWPIAQPREGERPEKTEDRDLRQKRCRPPSAKPPRRDAGGAITEHRNGRSPKNGVCPDRISSSSEPASSPHKDRDQLRAKRSQPFKGPRRVRVTWLKPAELRPRPGPARKPRNPPSDSGARNPWPQATAPAARATPRWARTQMHPAQRDSPGSSQMRPRRVVVKVRNHSKPRRRNRCPRAPAARPAAAIRGAAAL